MAHSFFPHPAHVDNDIQTVLLFSLKQVPVKINVGSPIFLEILTVTD
jgi:hypothetical protein